MKWEGKGLVATETPEYWRCPTHGMSREVNFTTECHWPKREAAHVAGDRSGLGVLHKPVGVQIILSQGPGAGPGDAGFGFALVGFSLPLFGYFSFILPSEMGICMLGHCILGVCNLGFLFVCLFVFILADRQELVLSLIRDFEPWKLNSTETVKTMEDFQS